MNRSIPYNRSVKSVGFYKILSSVCFYTLPVYTGCGIIRAWTCWRWL